MLGGLLMIEAPIWGDGYGPGLVDSWGGSYGAPDDLQGVRSIARGYQHGLAVLTNGTVVAWGNNWAGATEVPTDLTSVLSVAAGGSFSMALLENGTVRVWGNGSDGLTNVPPALHDVVQIAAGSGHCLALQTDGTVIGWGSNSSGESTPPETLTNAIAISAEGRHSLALRADGSVVSWGRTNLSSLEEGEFITPPEQVNAVAIAAGDWHTVVLRSDGTVMAWGANHYGQAEVPIGLNDVVAIAAGQLHSLALKDDGTVVAWGDNEFYQTNVPAGLCNVIAIASGGDSCLALTGVPPRAPPLVNLLVAQPTVWTGQSLLIEVCPCGTPPLEYQWRHNGVDIPNQQGLTLALTNLHWRDAGKYSLVASNAFGVASSTPLEIDVRRFPPVPPDYFVTTTIDAGPGSLRQAILEANAKPGGDEVGLFVAGQIILQSPLPPVTDDLSMWGPGTNLLSISGNREHRIFSVAEGVSMRIVDVLLKWGSITNAHGGVIHNAGRLAISNCAVTDGLAYGGSGGGIFNLGSLEIVNSYFARNYSWGGSSPATYPRYDGGMGVGGAIYQAQGSLSISNSVLTRNAASGGGGYTDLYCIACAAGDGGDGFGGAVYVAHGDVLITHTTLYRNEAQGGAGGSTYSLGSVGGSGGRAAGGAVYVEQGTLSLQNTTISLNSAWGGAAGGAAQCRYAGDGGDAAGAGLYIDARATASVFQATLFRNFVLGGAANARCEPDSTPGASLGGGIFLGGGLQATNMALFSSIVASNHIIGGGGSDVAGHVQSLGFNLITETNQSGGWIQGDVLQVAPLLGPLQDNGGPTWTHALLSGSPAIDHGNGRGVDADQRGQPRAIDVEGVVNGMGSDGADIGAMELDPRLRLVDIRRVESNILIRFPTVSDRTYGVAYSTGLPWRSGTVLTSGVSGTGGWISVTNQGARSSVERYYRVYLEPQ